MGLNAPSLRWLVKGKLHVEFVRQEFRTGLRDFAHDTLLAGGSRSREFLDPAAVRRMIAAQDRRGRDLSRRPWTLVVLEEWCRRCLSSS